MGSVTKLGEGRWRVRWRAGYGRDAPRRERVFQTKAAADTFLLKVEGDKAKGVYVDSSDGRMLFRAYAEDWLARRKCGPATLEQYRHTLSHDVYPVLGALPLAAIRPTHLDELASSLTRLAASTRRQRMLVVAMVFKAAVRDRILPSSPVDLVELPRAQRPLPRFLTKDQARALRRAAGSIAGEVALGLGAGLRQGEVFGVTPARVDFLRREVHVLDQGPGLPLKTPASRRSVPVPQWVLDVLAPLCEGKDRDELLFTTAAGKRWQRSSWNASRWKPAIGRAGLDPKLGFHCVRHTYASLLIDAGLHPRAIQARMGHASITETMDTYGHLMPEAAEETRQAMEDALGDLAEEPGDAAGVDHDQ